MCTGLEVAAIAAVAGGGMQMYGASKQAEAQREAAAGARMGGLMAADNQAQAGVNALERTAYEAEMREYEAGKVRLMAQEKADTIIAAAHRFRSNQTATSAAQGIMVHEGSAQTVRDDTTMLAERDALVAIYSGNEKALIKTNEAEQIRKTGSNAFQQSFMTGTETRLAAKMQYDAAQKSADATLLSGIGGGISSMGSAYSAYNKPTGPTV